MVELFAATIISCRDAVSIINRLSNVVGLSYQQKVELVKTLKEYIPSCPVIVQIYEQPRTN
jgi:hypothetical protein